MCGAEKPGDCLGRADSTLPLASFRSCQCLCLDKAGSPPRNFRMPLLQPGRSSIAKEIIGWVLLFSASREKVSGADRTDPLRAGLRHRRCRLGLSIGGAARGQCRGAKSLGRAGPGLSTAVLAKTTGFQDPARTARSPQREELCWKGSVGGPWVYAHECRRAKKLIPVS